MTVSLAQSAIAFLIDLAEQGEIDPWDVKVIEVIDRFLKTLKTEPAALPESGRSPYEASLSESGKALHRRAIAPPPERRQVTLNELIEQLETIAAVISDQPPRTRARRARPVPKRHAVRAITQLAHQENLSEIAEALEGFLDQYWDTLEEQLSWLNFEELLTEWPKYKPDMDNHVAESAEAAEKHERVGVFWGLLYLSAQSKVELSQQELYSELWVRNLKQIGDNGDSDVPPHVLPD